MTDTVKLIIEISKDYYEIIKHEVEHNLTDYRPLKIIGNGIPLDDVKAKWIPVTERLPLLRSTYKFSDDVLITNGYGIGLGYLVERKGKIFWHYYGSEYEVGIKDEDNDAIAWMPLPEPYKVESEDKE